MGDVVVCEDFLPFLRGEKTLFKQGGRGKNCEQSLSTIPRRDCRTTSYQASVVLCVHTFLSWRGSLCLESILHVSAPPATSTQLQNPISLFFHAFNHL